MKELHSSPAKALKEQLNHALMMQLAAGDRTAFCAFYYATQHIVYGYILALLRCPRDAEEVMRETYLRIRERVYPYHPFENPLVWVLSLARSLSLIKLESRENGTLYSLEDAEAIGALSVSYGGCKDRLVLERALRTLNEGSRQVVVLHAITGLRHWEIARMLGLSLFAELSCYFHSMKGLAADLTDSSCSIRFSLGPIYLGAHTNLA